MPSLSTAWKILRDLGLSWVLKRLSLAAQIRFGIVKRRLPLQNWGFDPPYWRGSRPGENSATQVLKNRFCFDALPALPSGATICEQADRVLSGEWQLFSNQWLPLGFPPDWHLNALDGTRIAIDRHWSEIDLKAIHDVKFVWEMNRFSVTYLLARAYAASGNERYPQAFWELVEDWADKNSPNRGVNWTSGQEVALRAIAWCFGLRTFLKASSSTPKRISRLLHMIEVHGTRIAGFIDYAIVQKNNHGISEAVGLFTIGTIFPELELAGKWLVLGKALIESQIRDQVYEDGSYIQHSFNYQRVFIDCLVWAFRLGEVNERPFSKESYAILERATRFMLRFCDPANGRMPNYGSNDGSLVLPLGSCDFLDYRPSLQAAHYLVHREFCFEKGEWNEQCEWLFGVESTQRGNNRGPHSRVEIQRNPSISGYLKLAAHESNVMLRAGRYVDRPSQADQLHLDLWWRGENIACDAGTYLYNAPRPWTNALAASAAHNTITVSDRDQMTRAGRFLWVDWAQADWMEYEVGDSCRVIEAWHDGYEKVGAKHRRSVACIPEEDCWIVVDDILGAFRGALRLHWLFANYPHEWRSNELRLLLQTPVGEFQCCVHSEQPKTATLVTGGMACVSAPGISNFTSQTRGWRSLYYGQKDPALSLAVETRAQLPVRFVTMFTPSSVRSIKIDEAAIEISADGEMYRLSLRPAGSQRIFSDVGRSVAASSAKSKM